MSDICQIYQPIAAFRTMREDWSFDKNIPPELDNKLSVMLVTVGNALHYRKQLKHTHLYNIYWKVSASCVSWQYTNTANKIP